MITGAGGGLGAAIAEALAPTHTLFLAGRESARLDAVAERLGATTWPIDFADPDAIVETVEPIDALDVLVHNAGVAYPGRIGETSVDEWRATMEVNVVGAVALTLPLLPALRAAGGHVVFINSGAGRTPSLQINIDATKTAAIWWPTRAANTGPSGSCVPRRLRSSSPRRSTRRPTPTSTRSSSAPPRGGFSN